MEVDENGGSCTFVCTTSAGSLEGRAQPKRSGRKARHYQGSVLEAHGLLRRRKKGFCAIYYSYNRVPGEVMRDSDRYCNKVKALRARVGTGHTSNEDGEIGCNKNNPSMGSGSEDAVYEGEAYARQFQKRGTEALPKTAPPQPQKEEKRRRPISLALAAPKRRHVFCSSVSHAGTSLPPQKRLPNTSFVQALSHKSQLL